jgi:hypothetical protein
MSREAGELGGNRIARPGGAEVLMLNSDMAQTDLLVCRQTFRFPLVQSAWKVDKAPEERRVHSLAEACRLQYMVTSFFSHHDIAVWDGQRHGIDVVDIVGGPLLVPISVPSRLQFDRDVGTRHCANERTSRLLIRDDFRQRQTALCQGTRQDILEFDYESTR